MFTKTGLNIFKMYIEYARLYSFFLNSLDTLIQWDVLQE